MPLVDPAILAVALMVIVIVVSILPLVPGPALVWMIGVIYATLTGFERVTWVAVAIMTVFMLLGVTSGWWMQALGMRAQGGSCLGTVGALLGGVVGTFVIPVPIVGSAVGMVAGAVLFEFVRARRLSVAIRTGGATIAAYLAGLAVEMATSILILVVFVGSLLIGG